MMGRTAKLTEGAEAVNWAMTRMPVGANNHEIGGWDEITEQSQWFGYVNGGFEFSVLIPFRW